MMTPVEQFRQAMAGHGIILPPDIIADGRVHRFSTNGKRGDDAGAYVFHADGIQNGWVQNHRTGERFEWSLKGRKLSQEEAKLASDEMAAARARREAERAAEQAEAARQAAELWARALPADVNHPYLKRKGIAPHGIKQTNLLHLIVPVYRSEELTGVQFIDLNGSKRFLPGTAKEGGYFIIGEARDVLCIAEGFATAASIHEATGYTCVVAFDAGNLMPVAKAIRQRFPEAGIILAADDDYSRVNLQTKLPENIGLIKANKAAAAIGARLAVPRWQEHRDEKATDFNDLAVAEGPGAVRRCIEAAEHVEPLPEEEPEPGQDQETPGQDQETPAEKDDPAFRPICARELLRNPAPPRRWIVEDFIPAGQVTLFAGDGGTGKSTVAMQLALAAATGTSWLEMPVEPVRVLVLSAEDDRDEMHWRLAKMIKAIPGDRDENLEALAGRLWLLDATGALDPTLAKWDSKTGNFSVTDTYERICHFVASHDIGLVILDSAADIFAEENDRHAVRTLIRTLKQLGCTVLLLGHPSVDGMKSNRGYSGSTHWNNAVRSRLYFTRPTDSGGNVIDLDLRRLVVSKANRSRLGAEIILRWTEGGFVREEDTAAGSDDLARQLRAEEVFLNLLKRFCEEGRPPSPNRSPSFAPTQFAAHPDSEGISKASFEHAMNRLLSAKKIEIVKSGTKSREYQRLKVKEVA